MGAPGLSSTDRIAKRLAERNLLHIVEAEAGAHFVTVADICGSRRSRSIVRARHAAWRVLRAEPYRFSYPEIARLFGVDHTTVMSGVRTAEEREAFAVAKKQRGAAA